MSTEVNRRIRLRSRPEGRIDSSTFEVVEEGVPEPAAGQALIRNLYLSIDPTNRVWIREEPSYLPPVGIGDVMRSGGIGRVVASNNEGFPEGSLVTGLLGWQDYVLAGEGEATLAMPLPPGLDAPLESLVGLLGITGLTAYFGIEDIGEPQEGETVVVSAAAGAVGSIAGQLAKLRGARVVGIAGGADKCSWLVDELGFDAAVDRHDARWSELLADACPDGVDVDFENVGGEIMDTVFGMLNLHSRVVLCGLISQYNATEPQPGPSNFPRFISRRVRLQGFLVFDYLPRYAEASAKLAQWAGEGKIKHRDTVLEGLEKAPEAVNMLFEGGNVGKLMVKIADDTELETRPVAGAAADA
jgi:NADPH-dependent curcumin reductase CurA